MKKIITLIAAFVMLCSVSYAKETVFVSILPIKFIADQILGEKFEVKALVPENSNPHTYEPKPKDLIKLSNSKIFFSIGDNFEHIWLEKLKQLSSDINIIKIDTDIKKILFNKEHEHEHQHQHAQLYDPHIWISLKNAKILAGNIYKSIIVIDPTNTKYYRNNLKRFDKKIDILVEKVNQSIKHSNIKKFLVFHPSWGYFAKEFNLLQIPVEVGGKEPSIKHLKNIIDIAKKNNIKFIFAQPQINSKIVNTIAKQLGAKVVLLNPLKYNYLTEFEKISNILNKND